NRIEEILDHPITCPHGHPIPTKTKYGRVFSGNSITTFAVAEEVVISQIQQENTEFLKKLSTIGIEMGTKLRIIDKSPVDGTLLLEINGKNISLSKETAKKLIGIKLCEPEG
ncbi:MAG: FeoA domain-containing protein, partial [Candidatus Helarchaeota archaeon]